MPLSDTIAFLRAKDTLRKIRYTVRREAGLLDRTLDVIGSEFGAKSLPFHVLPEKPVLHLSDAVFGRLERAAKAALHEPEEHGILLAPLKPVSSLLRNSALNDHARGPADFVTVLYRYSRHLLSGLPVENFYISEHAIESARQNVQSRHGALISSVSGFNQSVEELPAEALELQVQLCAALACEIEAARPIRRLDLSRKTSVPSQQLATSPNVFCAAAIGLAMAVASTRHSAVTMRASEVLDTAKLVTEARFARFSAAIEADDAVQRLAGEFMRVLPHLP
jgi:hypothetical protein